jgi:hypothetical protein
MINIMLKERLIERLNISHMAMPRLLSIELLNLHIESSIEIAMNTC